jgi:ferrochelatase
VPFYIRVPALGTDPGFIGALADLVRQMTTNDESIVAGEGARICPAGCGRCPHAA